MVVEYEYLNKYREESSRDRWFDLSLSSNWLNSTCPAGCYFWISAGLSSLSIVRIVLNMDNIRCHHYIFIHSCLRCCRLR
jgi:hypothetical protein